MFESMGVGTFKNTIKSFLGHDLGIGLEDSLVASSDLKSLPLSNWKGSFVDLSGHDQFERVRDECCDIASCSGDHGFFSVI